VTADLPDESAIRDDHEVVELSDRRPDGSVLIAAVQFVRMQFRMCLTIARRDESVVLFFGATAYLLPICVAKLLGRTVILEPRGDVPLTLRLTWGNRMPALLARLLAGIVRSLERIGYLVADGIITYTPAMASELGLDRFESKLYPNGARYVDTDLFAPRVPIEDRPRRVGFLGRIDEEKNVRRLAAAACELPSDITFRFIGDGALRGQLETDLASAVDAGQVEFTGWVDHDSVPAELSELRLLLLPSEPTEGLPTVILESLACGTPVMATPVAGVPDVIRPGKTGLFLESTTPSAIAADIVAAVDDDIETMSRQGRELIEEEYSFEAAVDRYRRILGSIATHST
jgi:glycosyltransferase involved in cell wall biosynthesis